MREGWRHADLRECVEEIRSGKSVNSIEEPANSDQIGVLKTSCVYNGKFDPRENKAVVSEEHSLVKCQVTAGTIIVSRMNTSDLVGASGYVDQDHPNIFLPDRLWAVFPKHGVDPVWLYYVTSSPEIRARLSDNASGTSASMKNISQDVFLSMPARIPPLPEQRKIAEILRTWDDAIAKLEALRATKLRRHRTLTHSLVFGTRQLNRFRTTDEVAEHRWFTLPATWSSKPIGKLAREISERNGDAEQHEVLSCSKYDGFVRSLEYFKKQVFSADLSGYKKIWRGDFGFPSNHIEEGSIGLQNLTDVGVVSPIYTVFRFASDKVDADYAFAVLKTGLYRHIFEVSTSASVDRRGSLRWSEFSKLPFPVPSLVEQKAIAEVLRTAQADLDALNTEIETLTRQKRGLMQKLLTGEWRVKVDHSRTTNQAKEAVNG